MSRNLNASIDQSLRTATAHHRQGNLAQAQELYRHILVQDPRHADALHLLGLIAHQQGQHQQAIDLIQQAIVANASMPSYYHNLGLALASLGQLEQAAAAFEKALGLKGDLAQAHFPLAKCYKALGRLDEAIAEYRLAAARSAPGIAPPIEAQFELAVALQMRGHSTEAAAVYRALLIKAPHLAEAHNNLGKIRKDAGDFDAAAAEYRQAIALRPNLAEAHNNLGNALKEAGRVAEGLSEFHAAFAMAPNYHVAYCNYIYSSHFDPCVDAAEIAARCRQWQERCAQPLKAEIPPHEIDRSSDRRLRIGYVSPDFRDHVVGRNVLPLLAHHDREQFEIVCYSGVLRPDKLTAHFQTLADHWRDATKLNDHRLAEQIRDDQIDILVDLTLHMDGNRLLTFARKPTAVQICFAGYPGGTGLDTIDYRVSDEHLDPPGTTEHFYREKTLRLESFWCFDPAEEILGTSPPVNALPAANDGRITFGCLNNFCKVTEEALNLWSQILRKVENSRLMLLCPEGSARQRVLDALSGGGIDAQRIELVSRLPRLQYLALYNQIDLMLDTFPYNGHSTMLDALWMGLPAVTLALPPEMPAVGRGGKSILSNLGLSDFVADDSEKYVTTAVQCAGDLPRLSELRLQLRSRMRSSILINADRFTRQIESAYRQAWSTLP